MEIKRNTTTLNLQTNYYYENTIPGKQTRKLKLQLLQNLQFYQASEIRIIQIDQQPKSTKVSTSDKHEVPIQDL